MEKQPRQKKIAQKTISSGFERNKREIAPHLSETHKLLTAVQFGDRAALSIRKKMTLDETGPLPASKALGLLEQYNTAAKNYKTAVEALCKAANLPFNSSWR